MTGYYISTSSNIVKLFLLMKIYFVLVGYPSLNAITKAITRKNVHQQRRMLHGSFFDILQPQEVSTKSHYRIDAGNSRLNWQTLLSGGILLAPYTQGVVPR